MGHYEKCTYNGTEKRSKLKMDIPSPGLEAASELITATIGCGGIAFGLAGGLAGLAGLSSIATSGLAWAIDMPNVAQYSLQVAGSFLAWGAATMASAATMVYSLLHRTTIKNALITGTALCGCLATSYVGIKQMAIGEPDRILVSAQRASEKLTHLKESHPEYATLQQKVATAPQRAQQARQNHQKQDPIFWSTLATTFVMSAGAALYLRRRKDERVRW